MTDQPESSQTDAIATHRVTLEYSAYYAVQEPPASGSPPPLLVAAHGYGQSAKSFLRGLEALKDEPLLVAAPQGPNAFYWQSNPPKIGFSWMTSYRREQAIADLMAYMERFWADLRTRYTFDPERVFLMGFSQGSALAFRFGTSGIVRPAGIIACGGDLPPDVAERLDDIPRVPVLIVHGTNDPAMGLAKAQEGEAQLREAGFDVATHYFDGAHEIPEEALQAIVAWIKAQTNAGRAGA